MRKKEKNPEFTLSILKYVKLQLINGGILCFEGIISGIHSSSLLPFSWVYKTTSTWSALSGS